MFTKENETKELKEFLKSNDIFNKILFEVLIYKEIFTISDIKSIKEKDFDEIKRKVRVETYKSIKIQKKQLRIDKCLDKFEKIWRKKSGILKTSILNFQKKTKNQVSKEPKNYKEYTKLKNYLKENNIFIRDLYDTLINENILTPNDFNKIKTNKKFDEMMTKIKVKRRNELKDIITQQRLEKKLTIFEKLWRKKTGIKQHSSLLDNPYIDTNLIIDKDLNDNFILKYSQYTKIDLDKQKTKGNS